MTADYFKAQLDAVALTVNKTAKEKGSVMVAIDGRCASGKTTFASMLAEKLSANLFHMDDFFLRPEQRTAERLSTPGGNVDRERFLSEVLLPLSRRENVTYRPFDCSTCSLMPPLNVKYKPINVIEGAYSCHPELSGYYDLKIFFSVSSHEQLERIRKRNGDVALQAFKTRWIPLEEAYISHFDVSSKCDFVIE